MVEDGSKVFVCRDTTIELSSTVEISPTANVILRCRNKGCKITTSSTFSDFHMIRTPRGVVSTHKVKFAGISFVDAGNGNADSLFALAGGTTIISQLKRKECVIQGNDVGSNLFFVAEGVLRIIGCDIDSNVAGSGFELIFGAEKSKIVIKRVNISSNTVSGSDVIDISDVVMVMKNVNVTSNSGSSAVLETFASRVRMTGVNFVDNQAGDALASARAGTAKVSITRQVAEMGLYPAIASAPSAFWTACWSAASLKILST
mgnify:CR=1 FL=1